MRLRRSVALHCGFVVPFASGGVWVGEWEEEEEGWKGGRERSVGDRGGWVYMQMSGLTCDSG